MFLLKKSKSKKQSKRGLRDADLGVVMRVLRLRLKARLEFAFNSDYKLSIVDSCLSVAK